MPLITVSLYPGRTEKQKEDFAKAITKSAVEILKTKENQVIVVFEEHNYLVLFCLENFYCRFRYGFCKIHNEICSRNSQDKREPGNCVLQRPQLPGSLLS